MKLIARIVTTIYFLLFYRIEVIGAEKLPEKGPALVCGNHKGMLDMFFIGYKLKRWVHWMAKEELFRNPILGSLFTALGAFPIKRGKGDVGSIRKAYKLLENGHVVGIFPQGTRVAPENRKTARIKPGAAMLALNTGACVVPVAIVGSYKPLSKVRVIFGEPIRPEKEEGKKYSSEDFTEFSRIIMDKVFSLMEE